uniref:Uncharacterized protein n=1 Tax=Rhizophora mucronata TaxID=61149 RepID=A0A2P2N6G7_RHIMU
MEGESRQLELRRGCNKLSSSSSSSYFYIKEL